MAFDMTTALTIKANVVGQGQLGGLENGLKKVSGQTNRTATAMTRLRGAASGALGAMRSFLPVLGVAGIAAFAKNNINAADSMSKLSQRTGIAAPMLDKFRKVAELSDTSINSLERAFPALTKNIDDAAQKGKGPAFDAFTRLGVAITDSSGKVRSADQVMLDISDRFAKMADGTEKAALASAVFGTRIGSELIPLLNSGGDAVRNMGTALTQEFADKAAAFNDRLETMQEKLGDVGLRLTEALLPALEISVGFIEKIGTAFSQLSPPMQTAVVGLAAVSAAIVVLSPVVSLVTAAFSALAALKIGATIAGWAAVILKIGGTLTGLLKIIGAVFAGPVGWVALLVAAGVAIYNFRDQIGDALSSIGDLFKDGFDFIKDVFVKPVAEVMEDLVEGIAKAFAGIGQLISKPFVAAFNYVKKAVNAVLKVVVGGINAAIGSINKIIQGANKALGALKMGSIPYVSKVGVPQFAEGGVVNRPTVAMVGEGGEPEYIIPQSKMARAAANYLGGMRGRSVIPAFAEGGVVGPGADAGLMGGGAANTTVQITTGPVLQQDGQQYVTIGDLERALEDFSSQLFRNSRSYGGRRYQGVL
jgi:hypothetical protein